MNNIRWLSLFLSLVTTMECNAQSDWRTFKHHVHKYAISYPSNWTVRDMAAHIEFVRTIDKDTGQLPERVTIKVESHKDDPIILDKLAEENHDAIKQLMGAKGVLKESKTNVRGLPAYKYDEYIETDGIKVHVNEYLILKNNVAYLFTYTAQPATFAKYEPTVSKMIKSFKFPK